MPRVCGGLGNLAEDVRKFVGFGAGAPAMSASGGC
jgi:hypothetical protein